jgi:hypothetical protein
MALNKTQDEEEEKLNQWISAIVDIECENKRIAKTEISKIIGPPSSLLKKEELNEFSSMIQILVKIDEKVYLDSIDIYEIQSNGFLLSKIEAKNEENDDWICLWESNKPRHLTLENRIFQPIITPTMFKSNILRLTTKSVSFIDAIG